MDLISNQYIFLLLYTITSIGMLYFGADFLISGALSTAARLKISEMIVSITLIAWATSLPELFVLSKAISLSSGSTIAYGTILGSNFANICLVLGLSIFIKFNQKFSFNFFSFKNFIPISIFSTIIFSIYGLNLFDSLLIKKLLSVLMIIAIILYVLRSNKVANNYLKQETKIFSTKKTIIRVVLGVSLLAVGSEFLVKTGLKLQIDLGVASSFIGSIYFALASSSPEIFTSLLAIFKYRKHDVVIGNVLGSNLANICIFGIIALIFNTKPITLGFPPSILLVSLEIAIFGLFIIYYLKSKKEKTIHVHSIVGFLLFYVYYLFYKFL